MKPYTPRRGGRGVFLLIAVRKEHSTLRSRAHMRYSLPLLQLGHQLVLEHKPHAENLKFYTMSCMGLGVLDSNNRGYP